MPPRRKVAQDPGAAGVDQPDERLSSATENYLLSLYTLWEDAEAPTVTQLTDALKQLPSTEELGTSVPSVAGMIRRMQRQRLVEIGQDKRIRLTKRGLEGGEDIARRHRLAEWLVVQILGMDLHRAYIEAHRLEHGISPELEAKLMEKLDYPKKSPFGRSIPGTGQPTIPADAIPLDTATLNVTYTVERVPEADEQLIKFLSESLIIPEHPVKVVESAPYLGILMVSTEQDKISIGYAVAKDILVRQLSED